MSDAASERIQLAAVMVFLAAISAIIGHSIGKHEARNEAFDRGYMVKCLGKTGYHWGCGDE